MSRAAARGWAGANSTDILLPLGIGVLLAAIALRAGGGLQLQPTTEVEMALELGGGAIAAGSLLAGRDRRAAHGMPALLCFAALVAFTIASVLWSVNPSDSWQEASRTLSYAVVFGVAMAFARFAPHRWAALVSYTSDGLPVAEEVRRGVWATGAYNGTGNVVGALCGRAVAQLAVSGRTELLL